jgi:hypothetical protein
LWRGCKNRLPNESHSGKSDTDCDFLGGIPDGNELLCFERLLNDPILPARCEIGFPPNKLRRNMTMTPRSRSLGLEILEDRDVPSATVWGTPWPNADHLTLSFAPDGTQISGQSSTLSTVLANSGSNAEQVILSAFQTWADYADINLGLVSDGGEAFGIGKAVEDDPRFGDIRVGAIPLDSSVLAVTSPFNYLSTYSGDMVFNAGEPIGTTYNLYAVALHEVGTRARIARQQ